MKKQKRARASTRQLSALDPVGESLIHRLKDAGVRGKRLRRYHKLILMCGPSYVWKDVVRHEKNRGRRLQALR